MCSDLQDPSVRMNEVEMSLFSPFRPMLAERAAIEEARAEMNRSVSHLKDIGLLLEMLKLSKLIK